jgi:hypothetical protein
MNGSPVAGLVRGWVDLYTRGLPADARTARRDEIDDDLWCEHAEAAAAGRSARSLDADLFLRLLFGLPADVSWRLAYRGRTAAERMKRSSSMNARILGVLAIMYGLSFATLVVLSAQVGEEGLWTTFGWFAVPVFVTGTIAFAATALGLLGLLNDRVSMLGVVGAVLATLGSLGPLSNDADWARIAPAPLMVGSAMLMWDLAGIGVVSRWIPIVQGPIAIGYTVSLLLGPPANGLFFPYLLSWVAIGVSLIRGVPQAQARSG